MVRAVGTLTGKNREEKVVCDGGRSLRNGSCR